MDNQIVPINKAGELLGISDLDKLNKAATRYGADVLIAGSLLYINIEMFNKGVQAEIASKTQKATDRATAKGEKGRSIGLLRARIARGPQLIEAKKKAVEIAKTALSEAKTNWDQYQAKRKLTELEEQLKRLMGNMATDQAELEKFLGELPKD